jgi:prealbumin domain-containing protein
MTLNRRRRRAGVLTALSLCLAGVGLLPHAAAASNTPNWSNGGHATIRVVKRVFQEGQSPNTAVAAGGWEFKSSTSGVTPPSGRTANGTGAVTFSVKLGGQRAETVSLAETPQPGFTLYPVNGWNAYCTSNGRPVRTTNDGPDGFKVDAWNGAYITCTVLNKASKPPAEVVVYKKWVINGHTFDNGQQPPGFEAQLQLTGQQNPDFGTVYAGYSKGERITIGETLNTAVLPPGCWPRKPSGDLGDHWLKAGLNRFVVFDKFSCKTTLTLFKRVVNPFGPAADPRAWTLTAFLGGKPTSISGQTGVHGFIQPGLRYQLGESGGVPGYQQEIVPGAVITPPATGSWRCVQRLRGGGTGPVFDGADGGVTADVGQYVECTAVNTAQSAKLTLVKRVINDDGNAKPTDWILHAIPAIKSGHPKPIEGRSGSASVTGAAAVPGVAYRLSESDGPSNYKLTDLRCVLTGTSTEVPIAKDWSITMGLDEDVTCTFTNKQTEALPVTGNITGPVAGVGVGIFLLGLVLFIAAHKWRRLTDD